MSIDLNHKDTLFQADPYPKAFRFDEQVANVFDDMLLRSVPLYQEVLQALGDWGSKYYRDGTNIYDIGCSKGAAMFAIASKTKTPVRFVGIDSSESMLEHAQQRSKQFGDRHDFEFYCQDGQSFAYHNASIVILNYTLQFIPVEQRQDFLKKLYKSQSKNGLLFLSDKIISLDKAINAEMDNAYYAFKRQNGYTDAEIERKKQALQGILIPVSLQEQLDFIISAGYSRHEILFKWNNFVTVIAIK